MRSPTAIGIVGACFFALVGAPSHAAAATFTIDGVSVELPVPADLCELTGSEPSDRHLIDSMGELMTRASGARLLAVSADCRQLADWRAGKRLFANYAQYSVPRAAAVSADVFRQACAAIRRRGADSHWATNDDVESRLEEFIKGSKVNEQSLVGFLGEEPAACYAGILQKAKSQSGTDVVQLTILAIARVKDKLVLVNRYAPYENAVTVNDTLTKLKSTVAAVLAANRI
jgi:hypothetical protein